MPADKSPQNSMQRLGELIARLDEVQREIQALTSDQVDAVVMPDGLPFLLSGAQDALRRHEQEQRAFAEQRAAILDALPAKVALLDETGEITATNARWRRSMDGSDATPADGQNYLEVCDRVRGEDAEQASASAAGIREVLAGERDSFSLDYPCPTPQVPDCWYRLLVAPLPGDAGKRAVVMHIDVTKERRAEAHARREEQYFRQLFESSPVPKWVLDDDSLRFLEVNRAAIEHYGYSRERFLEMTIRDVRARDQRAQHEHDHRAPESDLSQGQQQSLERHLCADGSVVDVEVLSAALELDGRDARLMMMTDVSERLRERRRKEIESEALACISSREPLDGILRMLVEGLEEMVPQSVASIVLLADDGTNVAEVAAPSLSKRFTEALKSTDVNSDAGPCGAALHRGDTVVVDDIGADPKWRALSGLADEAGLRACLALPVRDSEQRVTGSVSVYYREPRTPESWERELAEFLGSLAGLAVERHRQDEALATSERRLRKLFREAATGIVVVTEAGEFERANGVFAAFLNCPEDRLATMNYHEITHSDDRDASLAAMRRLLSGETRAETLEQRFDTLDGKEVWGRVRLSAQAGHDGSPNRVIGVIEDTTLRKRAELRLERAHALQRIAGRIGRVGGWSLDIRRNRVFWSQEIFDILEWDGNETPPLSETLSLYPPADRARVQSAIRRCSEEAVPFDIEAEIETRRGRRLQVRAAGEPETGPDGKVKRVIGVFQDITGQKRAEALRAELAARLENVLENMSDAFLLLDSDQKITYINRAGEQMVETGRDALIGQSLWEAFPEARNTEIPAQYERAVKSGTSAHFEVFYAPLRNWFEIHAYPFSDGVAAYFRKTTEKRHLEEQLAQSQRMESVGQLTGGIAHDFNNLLTVILGNAELLTESLADSEELEPIARNIGDAAMRGAELTRRLLAFARRQPLTPEPTDVQRLIRDLQSLLERALGEQCEIEISHGAGLWPAMIDSSQFESALMNLAINARDAMPDGGRLTIEAANVRIDDEYTRNHADIEPGQYVLVAVTDTGTGIPSENLDKVFEPFFTTKEKGRGTGLGLSMVYGFIKQSRGHIRIYSEGGEGTTVRLYLPRANGEAARPRVRDNSSAASRGESILVVEDEPSVREYVTKMLSQLGYRVESAPGGREALALLEEGAECDLLFTDVVMPGGMSGRALAEAAAALRPGLKVLYTSGYTENAIVHQGRLDPDVQLLSKPYRRDQLAQRVRRVLDDGPGGQDDSQDD